MVPVTRFGISLPVDIQYKFDDIIKEKACSYRSEAILDLVRDYI